MKVIVCGDRNWSNRRIVAKRLSRLPRGSLVITGGCSGADTLAAQEALAQKIDLLVLHARWDLYGSQRGSPAGPLRNIRMLEEGKLGLVIAFHNNLLRSKGTKDMTDRAKAAGIPVEIIRESSDSEQA